MVIVTPNTDHYIEKFKDKTFLGLDDIASENIIFTEEKSSLRTYLDTSIIEKEISFDSFLEFGNVESTKKLVKYGFGIAILPFLSILDEVKAKKLKYFKIKGLNVTRKILLLSLKEKQFSDSTTLFINYLKNNLKEFIESEGNEDLLKIL